MKGDSEQIDFRQTKNLPWEVPGHVGKSAWTQMEEHLYSKECGFYLCK